MNLEYTAVNYYPLTLQYSNKDAGADWKIFFQEKPEKRVYRTGTVPTRMEIVDSVVSLGWIPVVMIPILEIIAATCEVRE